MSKTIPEILDEAARLFELRNSDYGNAYQSQAELLFQLIGPVQLSTVDDYKRLTRISAIVAKLNRYAKNFEKGGHDDSSRDLIVFAAMLDEFQQECAEKDQEKYGNELRGES